MANGFGDTHRRLARSSQIEVALVDRADFNVWREIVGIGKHQSGEEFVFIEIAGQKNQPGAEAAGQGGGHGGVNAELAGFVRGRGDDAALFTTHSDGFASQTRVGRLLDGGEEGVGIKVDDGVG